MPHLILTDHTERDHLLPLTHTRPVALVRVGLWTIEEKWSAIGFEACSFRTQDHLQKLFPEQASGDRIYVNGAVLPTDELAEALNGLSPGESIFHGDRWLATRTDEAMKNPPETGRTYDGTVDVIDRPWKIFQLNDQEIRADIARIRSNRRSEEAPGHVQLIGEDIFIEPGAELLPCTINTTSGPVYIGRDTVVMEGSMVRGPFALMDHAQLKMGAKIYGATTIGPHSKVGGEVNNCVIFGYSNKAHDGFIGNSVIGEWCNLGADTNTSNLKNNYADVKIYNYALGRSESTHSQFCGLTMGDHAKAGINTMFNTGTVCGVFANVFGGDFPHRVIPDFGWGGATGFKNYRLADALDVAEKVMARRSIALTDEWKEAYTWVHDHFAKKAS